MDIAEHVENPVGKEHGSTQGQLATTSEAPLSPALAKLGVFLSAPPHHLLPAHLALPRSHTTSPSVSPGAPVD